MSSSIQSVVDTLLNIAPGARLRTQDTFENVLFGAEQAINRGNGFDSGGLTRQDLEAFSSTHNDSDLSITGSKQGISKSDLLNGFQEFVERMVKFSAALQEFAKKLFPALTVDQNGNVNWGGARS